MQFNSYSYIFALMLVVLAFWWIPARWRRAFLTLISIAFYATWKPAFIAVPLALSVGVFFAAGKIAANTKSKRTWFWTAVSFALGMLVFFRYQPLWSPAFATLTRLLVKSPAMGMLHIAVPLGISFYTFEAISYLIDVDQRRVKPTRFSDLFLFVMFWPHLIAGPIVRFRELIPQFEFKKNFDLAMLTGGLDRFILGLVQKNLLADPLGRWVEEGFLPGAVNTSLDNWFFAVAFGLQIYFDFAAYSNMAIGCARIIGIQLPENFHFPYHAKNPSDFWQRWHMTLSRWIRDYLFFPINVRYQGTPLPLYLSLLGVMALVGLWHGAGWGFVVWGLMHGAYLVAYRIWEDFQIRKWPHLQHSRIVHFAWRWLTLIGVIVAWVPFRAASGSQAYSMLHSMFLGLQFRISYSLNFYLVVCLVVALTAVEPIVLNAIEKWDKFMIDRQYLLFSHNYFFRPAIYAFGLLLFVIFDERDVQFIYFQF